MVISKEQNSCTPKTLNADMLFLVVAAYFPSLPEFSSKIDIRHTGTENNWGNDWATIFSDVMQPWYSTGWAYWLYMILITGYYFVQLYRYRQITLRQQVEITNLRIQREEDERRLNYFTDLSQEVRTSLMSIVEPVKDILIYMEAGQAKSDLNLVYCNSRRLLSSVCQVLSFKVPESQNGKLNCEIDRKSEGRDEINKHQLLISDRHCMLIVDDNIRTIKYIKRIFQQNFRIYTATNGAEGLVSCSKFLPDVVISDINIEGGRELSSLIKNDPALVHIPVILLTEVSDKADRVNSSETCTCDLFTKPLDKDKFTARIDGILRKRKYLQTYFYTEITLKSEMHEISRNANFFLQKCIDIIEENLMEANFTVKTLSLDLGMSHSNLYKKIKEASGLSVNGLIRFIRLRKAAELLIRTNLTINEVAVHVGINDIKYFRGHFQKVFKLTPSDFIKKHRTIFRNYHNVNSVN